MMRHAVVAIAILGAACGESPTAPTEPAGASRMPAADVLTVRGDVRDPANRPIASATIEVVTGARAGTTTATDAHGSFTLPGTFTKPVTVRASRDGYDAQEITSDPPAAPTAPVGVVLRFDLQHVDAPLRIAGRYVVTFTAAPECTQLPPDARQRTHLGQLTPGKVGWFTGYLSGDFLPDTETFDAEVLGVPPQALRIRVPDSPAPLAGLTERLTATTFLEIRGSADVPLNGGGGSAFDGTWAFCAGPTSSADPYRCPVPLVTCRSAAHRLTMSRQ